MYAGRITSAFVMELFIQHSYRRQTGKTAGAPAFMVLNESERKYFMSGVAADMGALDLPNQINREQFARAIKSLYELIPESVSKTREALPQATDKPLRQRLAGSEDAIEDISTDVRSTGILVFDQSKPGALRFAHKSFMEYLLAKTYADYITHIDRETSSAIVTASNLKASHLLRHEECKAFFAEVIINSLDTSEKQRTALTGRGSRLLFETIVVRPLGGGLLARIKAWIALKAVVIRAQRRFAESQNRFLRMLKALAYTYLNPETLPMLMFFVATQLWFQSRLILSPGRSLQLTRTLTSAWVLIPVIVLTVFWAIFVIRSLRPIESAVKLWFTSSRAVGMQMDDIASVAGRKGATAIERYLHDTEVSLRSYPLFKSG